VRPRLGASLYVRSTGVTVDEERIRAAPMTVDVRTTPAPYSVVARRAPSVHRFAAGEAAPTESFATLASRSTADYDLFIVTPRRCVACGAEQAATSSHEIFSLASYTVHRCGDCGSLATSPLPTQEKLVRHYADYNETYTAGMGPKRYVAEMPKRWRARLDLLQRAGGRGALLDLGGSNGMFGSLAHERGFRVSVADFVATSKDLGFATVTPADLSKRGGVPLPDSRFDVVTLWSCLEHVRDPEASFAEIHRLVRPGGLVAIDTPLVGDACERIFPARSHWICPPEHLHLYSAVGLDRAVRRAGFQPVFHSPFHERTRLRWIARRGRNLAVASLGLVLRAAARERWTRLREHAVTQAGDIQVIVCRRPEARAVV
jgi:SAM-dependent methyltransferase